MAASYAGRADFKVVYVREAHPDDGWQVPKNRRAGIVFNSPKTLAEREKIALQCETALALKIPILLDNMDDATERAYRAWPDRIYVVDAKGKLAFVGDPGPRGFRPVEAETALKAVLGDK